ncbi:MAG: hypothetical protein KGJ58_02495 [Patescibacteria group bacterium]|nr:hypothetical protein [Patescibacteria group bacterium]MDE2218297.1 hypothetical protein [Patescibacteria group bacterium]
MRKTLIKFFDKLEDGVRIRLSHRAISYAFVGGAATLLFWRGAWRTFDHIENLGGIFGILFSPEVSLILSIAVLLLTGLFVSVFIGERVIISGLKQEKKIFDKTESEIKEEEGLLFEVKLTMDKLRVDVSEIKEIMEGKKRKEP